VSEPYDYRARKIIIALAASLSPGEAVNIVGHLAVAAGAYVDDDLMGRRWLLDASGVQHTGISRYPVIVTKVKQNRLRRLLEDARKLKDLFIADYPEQMLSTGHDDELARELAAVSESDINYLGVLLCGGSAAVGELTGRFTLWS
jgi:hypothetical protein